jgi:hypothetical protein
MGKIYIIGNFFLGTLWQNKTIYPKRYSSSPCASIKKRQKNWALLVLIPIHLEKTVFIIVFNTLFAQSNAKSLIRNTYWRSQSLNNFDGLFFVLIDNQTCKSHKYDLFSKFSTISILQSCPIDEKANQIFL